MAVNSPESQLSQFVRLLRTAPPLQGWAQVRLGARERSKRSGTRQIVLVPQQGVIENPKLRNLAHYDVRRQVIAYLWGQTIDEVLELQTRFARAVAFQAAGGAFGNANAVAGYFVILESEVWDTSDDSERDGEEIAVTLIVYNSLAKAPQTTGQVLTTAFTLTTARLTSPMGTTDSVAIVASTDKLPLSGMITIDSEQMRYTGTTPTSFTGLVRGINSTTPAAHLSGATVNISGSP